MNPNTVFNQLHVSGWLVRTNKSLTGRYQLGYSKQGLSTYTRL